MPLFPNDMNYNLICEFVNICLYNNKNISAGRVKMFNYECFVWNNLSAPNAADRTDYMATPVSDTAEYATLAEARMLCAQ